MSLRCPLTFRRLTLPARGSDCRHLQPFDLESFLRANGEKCAANWRCPVCNRPTPLDAIEVDQFVWAAAQALADVEEVRIDTMARVSPVVVKVCTDSQLSVALLMGKNRFHELSVRSRR